MTMIISERPNHIIIRNKRDEYIHRPNDPYNTVKYGQYESNRILFAWDKEARVEETYDERIFNCYYKNELLQLRNSNDICEAILDGDKEQFIDVFKRNYYVLHKAQLIDNFIKENPLYENRVTRTKDNEFIVDNVFKVDGHANTYVLDRMRKKKKWNNLCTVIKKKNSPRVISTEEVGDIEIDSKTLDCMSKVLTLLHPITWDSVIWQQLPRWLSKIYKDELGIDKEK